MLPLLSSAAGNAALLKPAYLRTSMPKRASQPNSIEISLQTSVRNCAASCLRLRLARADLTRGRDDAVVERGRGEEDERDVEDRVEQKKERQRHEREFDGRGAAFRFRTGSAATLCVAAEAWSILSRGPSANVASMTSVWQQ